MVLVKSLFAGFAATVVAAVVTAVAAVGWMLVMSRNLPDAQAYGWDPLGFLGQSWLCWLILTTAFVLGFVWEYRSVGRG